MFPFFALLTPLVKSDDSSAAAAGNPSDSYQQQCRLIINPQGNREDNVPSLSLF